MSDIVENFWKVRKLYDTFIEQDIRGWLNNDVFTWNWWLLVVIFILPWLIWLKVYDKARSLETALCGSLSIIITTLLDVIGSDLCFWGYPIELLPIGPQAVSFDMAIIPVGYMMLYQYTKTWKQFHVALICMAGLYAFIGEPLSEWAELVIYIKWKYVYSFVYYIAAGSIIRVVVEKLKSWAYENKKDPTK